MTRGPTPKDPATRQRRNKSATRAELSDEEITLDNVPDMGTLEEEWHPLAIAWWVDVWTSPMAKQFLEVDKHSLYRILLLVQEFWTRPNLELSKDIDKAQQAFGLTPLDRRRLEWIVERTPPKPHKREADTPANVVSFAAGPDPRRGLI